MKTTLPSTELLSSQEIEIHYKRPLFEKMIHIRSSDKVNKVLRDYINFNQIDLKESFWVLLLSNANCLLSIVKVASGTSRGVLINTREILQLALKTNASAIIIAHNHPSGVLKPSASDIKQTKKLKTITKILEIDLLDHLILTSEDYLSFADNDLL